MSRAKHRAGLPVEAAATSSKKVTPKKTAKKPTTTDSSKWRTTGYFNKQHEHADEETTRALLKSRLENMNFRKPAGINERLIKVQQQREILQPANPHLLKVAVIGAANAGKSTLINKIVGEEVIFFEMNECLSRYLNVLQITRYQVYHPRHIPQEKEF